MPLPIKSPHQSQRSNKSGIPQPKPNTRGRSKEQISSLQQNCKDKVERTESALDSHQPSCGCHECIMVELKRVPGKDMASFKTCIESFLTTRTCPLSHPHDNTLLCSEYLKLEKESTMIRLDSVISSLMTDKVTKEPKHQIATVNVAKTSSASSSYSSYSKLKDSAQSAVNLQNLTSLTK